MKDIKLEIEKILTEKKIKKKKFLDDIGMSSGGYWEMFNNNSLKVSTLLRIAEVLQVPICMFFEDYRSGIEKSDLEKRMKSIEVRVTNLEAKIG